MKCKKPTIIFSSIRDNVFETEYEPLLYRISVFVITMDLMFFIISMIYYLMWSNSLLIVTNSIDNDFCIPLNKQVDVIYGSNQNIFESIKTYAITNININLFLLEETSLDKINKNYSTRCLDLVVGEFTINLDQRGNTTFMLLTNKLSNLKLKGIYYDKIANPYYTIRNDIRELYSSSDNLIKFICNKGLTDFSPFLCEVRQNLLTSINSSITITLAFHTFIIIILKSIKEKTISDVLRRKEVMEISSSDQ